MQPSFVRRVRVLQVLTLLAFLLLILRLAYIVVYWYPYYEYKRDPPPPTDSGVVYVVKPGDYLFAISKRFHVPLKSVIRLNNIKNPDLIYPGDKIRIPEPPPAYPNEEIIVALECPANFWKGVTKLWERLTE